MPKAGTVRIFSTTVFRRDAIGNFALAQRDLINQQGIPCSLYANAFDKNEPGITLTNHLFEDICTDDILFFHFSIHDPSAPVLADLPCRKILYFHNITPGHFFAPYMPDFKKHLDASYDQIAFASNYDLLMANSIYTGRILLEEMHKSGCKDALSRKVHPFPPVIGKQGWDREAVSPDAPLPERYMLFVGRFAPHKRVEKVIRIFHEIASTDPLMELILIGSRFPNYGEFIDQTISDLPANSARRITHMQDVNDNNLRHIYQNAAAFLSMSDHEGFCVPLMEAMHFGVPVFAPPQPAMIETLGNGGLILSSDSPAGAAREIMQTLDNPGQVKLMVDNQKKRVTQLVDEASGKKMLDLILNG